jgi:hypothetical protein
VTSQSTENRPRRPGLRRGRFVLLVIGVLVVSMALPFRASLRYRSAVHALHEELAAINPPSASVVEEYIDSCWQGAGPASIRHLQPSVATDLRTIWGDYLAALTIRGFTNQGISSSTRPRDDGLDRDVVTLTTLDDGVTLQIVADVYDLDLVTCLPFD